MDIFSFITMFGGLAMFLYGMSVMGQGLEQMSGGKLSSILERLTSNKLSGVLLGLGVTAIIQSSSATTVMLVGFVNSGIMRLGQTLSITMGANIGTTVTAWLISLTAINGDSFFLRILKPESFTPILALIGVGILMFSKQEKRKNLATIFIGFAVLMFGMETMSSAVDPLKESEAFKQIFVMFENPILGILTGIILTAIIQSSSASIGILQALSVTGAVTLSTAFPLILGMNIGTCITPVLSSIGGSANSKRTAISCVYIKAIGVVFVFVVVSIVRLFFDFDMSQTVNMVDIAVIHTLFNIVSTIILLPFTKPIEKLSYITFKDKKNTTVKSEYAELSILDDRFLTMPGFAIEKCRVLCNDMAITAKEAVFKAIDLTKNYDEKIAQEIINSEEKLDAFEDNLGSYLVKISVGTLSEKESRDLNILLHAIGDIERIGDHALNILEVAKEIHTKKITFSDKAKQELKTITAAIMEILEMTINAFVSNDLNHAREVEPLEEVIDELRAKLKTNHIKRVTEQECTIEMGFTYNDALTNYERIADHCSNIAVCMLEAEGNDMNSHEYLNIVKSEGNQFFTDRFNDYKEKYKI